MKNILAILSSTLFAMFSAPVAADTLADLVNRQIEAKDAEQSAKSSKISTSPAPAPVSSLAGAGQDVGSDDVAVLGVFGTNADLRAKVRVRGDTLVASTGMQLNGWTVYEIAPDSVTLVQLRQTKVKGKVIEKIVKKRMFYLTGAGFSPVSGTASTASTGSMPAGQPPLSMPH